MIDTTDPSIAQFFGKSVRIFHYYPSESDAKNDKNGWFDFYVYKGTIYIPQSTGCNGKKWYNLLDINRKLLRLLDWFSL